MWHVESWLGFGEGRECNCCWGRSAFALGTVLGIALGIAMEMLGVLVDVVW